MTPQNSGSHDIDRRTVLKASGMAAFAGAGLVGTASAHQTDGKPVFCGCSQVCACGDGEADVLVATEDGDDFTFTWIRDVEFNFCLSIDDPGVPDGKIIAVQVSGTRWVNPNQCAKKALMAEQEQLDSTHPRPEGEAGGPCGHPPCEHPGRGGRSSNGRRGGPGRGGGHGSRGRGGGRSNRGGNGRGR